MYPGRGVSSTYWVAQADTWHTTHDTWNDTSVAVNSHVSIPEERHSLDQGSLTAHFVKPIFQIDFFRFSLLPYLHFLGSVMNQSSLALGHIKQEKVPSSTNPTNSSPLTEYLTENLKPVGWNLLAWLPLPSVTVTNKRIRDRRTQGGILWSVASCDMLCSIAASLTHHESLLDALLAGQICHEALEPLHHDSEALWGLEYTEYTSLPHGSPVPWGTRSHTVCCTPVTYVVRSLLPITSSPGRSQSFTKGVRQTVTVRFWAVLPYWMKHFLTNFSWHSSSWDTWLNAVISGTRCFRVQVKRVSLVMYVKVVGRRTWLYPICLDHLAIPC